MGVAVLTLGLMFVLAQTPLYRIDAVTKSTFEAETEVSQVLLRNPLKAISDGKGGMYIADNGNHRIIQISAAGATRLTAGTGTLRLDSQIDGQVAAATPIPEVFDIALHPDGSLFIAFNSRIVKIDSAGKFVSFAGNGTSGFFGDGGPAQFAWINAFNSIAFDPQGRLLIGEWSFRIRRVDLDGRISTIAGTGFGARFGEGPAINLFVYPKAMACDRSGVIYFVNDNTNTGLLGRIDLNGRLSYLGFSGRAGDFFPSGVAVSDSGNTLFFTDVINQRVHSLDLASSTWTVVSGSGVRSPNIVPGAFSGDGGPAASARLNSPSGPSITSTGSLLFADSNNNRIRSISLGIINTVVGRSPVLQDGTISTSVELPEASRIFTSTNGDLYVAMPEGPFLGRIDASGKYSQLSAINNVEAGTFASDGRLFVVGRGNGQQSNPFRVLGPIGGVDVAFDESRNTLYSAGGLFVRSTRVDEATVTTARIAGVDNPGSSGDGGPASQASFRKIQGIALDRLGRIYVADEGSNRIRRIGLDGVVSTFAGNGTSNKPADNAPILNSPLNSPLGLVFGPTGNILVAEGNSRVVREIDSTTNTFRILAGSPDNLEGSTGDGGWAATARFFQIRSLAYGPQGQVYVLETYQGRSRIRVITRAALNVFEIRSGNNQTAPVGSRLPQPIQVRAVANNLPFPGLEVRFSGPATFDPPVALTNKDGIASTTVTLGANSGALAFTATNPSLTPLTFNAVATPNTLPTISSAAGAGAFGASRIISPGMWVEVFGTNLATSTRSWGVEDFNGDRGPNALDGVRVFISNRPAFVAYISPTQLNIQVPDGLPTGSVSLVVTNSNGSSTAFQLNVASTSASLLAPAVFSPYVAAILPDGFFAGPTGFIPGVAFRPAKSGEAITIYAIGLGPTNPSVSAGQITPSTAGLNSFSAQIGGRGAQVIYAGLAPGLVGLYQINLVVPGQLRGDQDLTITANGSRVGQQLKITVE